MFPLQQQQHPTSKGSAQVAAVQIHEKMGYFPPTPNPMDSLVLHRSQLSRFGSPGQASHRPSYCRIALPEDAAESSSNVIPATPSIHPQHDYNLPSRRRSSLYRIADLQTCPTPRTPPSPPTGDIPGPWHGRSLEATPRRVPSSYIDDPNSFLSFQGDFNDSWRLADPLCQQTTLSRGTIADSKMDQSIESSNAYLDSVQHSSLIGTPSSSSLASIYGFNASDSMRKIPESTSPLKRASKEFLPDLLDKERAVNRINTNNASPQKFPGSITELWAEACASRDQQKAVDLLKQGLSPNGEMTSLKVPPLILAVISGNESIVKLLLSAGANINGLDEKQKTALHYAAAAGQRNLVKLLVLAGANIYARSEEGLFPFQLASDNPTHLLLTLRMRSDMEGRIARSQMRLPDFPTSAVMKQSTFVDKDPSNLPCPSFRNIKKDKDLSNSSAERDIGNENVYHDCSYPSQNAADSAKHQLFLDQDHGNMACQLACSESSGHDSKYMDIDEDTSTSATLLDQSLKARSSMPTHGFHGTCFPRTKAMTPTLHVDSLKVPSYNVSRITWMDTDSNNPLQNVANAGKFFLDQDTDSSGSKPSSPMDVSSETKSFGDVGTFQKIVPSSPTGNLCKSRAVPFDTITSQMQNTATVLPTDSLEASSVSQNTYSNIGSTYQIMSATRVDTVKGGVNADCGFTTKQIAMGTAKQSTPVQQEPGKIEEDTTVIFLNQEENHGPITAIIRSPAFPVDNFDEASTGFHLRDQKDKWEENSFSEVSKAFDGTGRNKMQVGYVRDSTQMSKVTGSEKLIVEKSVLEESTECMQVVEERLEELFSAGDGQKLPILNDGQDGVVMKLEKYSQNKVSMDSRMINYLKGNDAHVVEEGSQETGSHVFGKLPNGGSNEREEPGCKSEEVRDYHNNTVSDSNEEILLLDKTVATSKTHEKADKQMQQFNDTRNIIGLQGAVSLECTEISIESSDQQHVSALKTKITEKTKEKKQVKFASPSEDDLAIIRKDWHDAARAGCTGCGKKGCGGKCLPQNAGYQKDKVDVNEVTSKRFFSKTDGKQVGIFQWKKGELLGEGAYGKVFAGLNQSTGELIAVKQLKINDPVDDQEKAFYLASLEREITLYKKIRHKHIVGYIGMEQDEASGSLFIFLEYVSGGSIQSMLERFGPFNEELVKVYTRQLLLGLEYLHQNRIVHRDIKGGNVLVDSNGVVKLGDFGASKAFHDPTITDGCKSIRGSIFWMAPEVIKGDGYGRRADIWSVGCTVIEMFTAMHPWPAIDNTWSAIFHIAKASSGPPIPENGSECAKDFLQECFKLNPRLRPTASELLQHPFVTADGTSSEYRIQD